MSPELGKIDKPPVEDFQGGRKLFFVPLILTPEEPEAELLERVNSYWEQVEAHLTGLEEKLGSVNQVYHELVARGGEDGAKAMEALNKGSYQIAKARLEKGAELQPVEDGELLAELMDWGRCLALGLESPPVFARVYQSYMEAQKRRNEHIAKQIDETLKPEERGILLMAEGHGVQFPGDIQVFYVAPPGLDEIKRWLRQRADEAQRRADQESQPPPGK